MDQYSKSGVVGRGETKATAELGEKLFAMVVDALVPMVKNALEEKEKISEYDNEDINNKDKTGAVRKWGSVHNKENNNNFANSKDR